MAQKKRQEQTPKLATGTLILQSPGKFPASLLQDFQQVTSIFTLLEAFSDTKLNPGNYLCKCLSVNDFQNEPAN